MKKLNSEKKGLKRNDSAGIEFTRTVSKSRLDESLNRNVSFTEDKFGSKSILADSINLDESVQYKKEHFSGFSEARKPTDDEVRFLQSIKGDIERTSSITFSTFEPVLLTSQNAGSMVYNVKIRIGEKYIHANVVRHHANTFGNKSFEILDVKLN